MPLASGASLGPYQVVSPLGSGGMGEVYKARDTRLDRTVAIKTLPADIAGDPHRRERFRREAQAISRLSHPNICHLYDVGSQDGIEFLVMEYLAGETLAHRLLRGPLPLQQALTVAAELAAALDAAHRDGVIHRDLKPANIMLTPDGAKVLDFGVAKWFSAVGDGATATIPGALSTVTAPGVLVGTVQYMSPEQLEGLDVDSRSDLFALGAIIYEMMTGRRAFAGEQSTTVIAAILSTDPPRLSTLNPLTPPMLDRIVTKCLAKDPARRWQSAADLRDELTWIAEAGAAAPVQTAATSSQLAPRRIWKYASGILLMATAVLAAFSAGRLTRTREIAPVATRLLVLPPDKTSVEVPIVSPDGRKIAFVARASDGTKALWVRSLESLEARKLVEANVDAFPFWSPDGKWIAFFGAGRLRKIAADGGASLVLCDAPSGRGGAWSRDGVIVFAPAAENVLYRVSAGGGTPVPATTLAKSPAERSHRFPQFLPDSRHFIYSVYFSEENQKPLVKAASLESTAATTLAETTYARAWAPPGYLVYFHEGSGYVAQPFDAEHLRLTGDPLSVAKQVGYGAVGGDTALSVSNNGVLAYQTAPAEQFSLTWFGRSGQRMSSFGEPGEYSSFALSPDGRRVAFARADDLWVLDVQRGVMSRVTSNADATDPRWSPDNERIAFASNVRRTGNWDLYEVTPDRNGSVKPLVISGHQNKFPNDWSRDGRLLLFQSLEGTSKSVGNLWVFAFDGGGRSTPYLVTDFNKSLARFSPDTRLVAYQSDLSGRVEIYVDTFPDPTVRTQVSASGGSDPAWRRDGKELFYIAADGMLMAVPVKTAPAFQAGPPAALFEVPPASRELTTSYEVTADGQRFLIANPLPGAERSPIIVTLNWTADLKR